VSKTVLTQFGRALKQLGIEHIAAYSPQARRRSERAFETLQHRLPKELKLAGIDTVEAANRWLSDTYIAEYNERFAIAAEQEGSAFMTDAMEAWREILCIQEDRTVGNDNTVRNLQLPPSRLRPHFVKATVRVHDYPDGQLAVYWGPHRLADYAPGRHLDAAAAKHRCGDRGQPCGLSLRHGIRTGGGWPLGRPAIAFRYVTLCRTWSAKPRRLIGPPVAPATRGMSSRAVGGSVANIRRARLWVCGQRSSRCPHTHRPSISRSVQILCLLRAVTTRPTVAANAFAASRVPDAPHAVKLGRMTRFHRGVPRRPCPARNMNEADRSRATKTRHID
jgi:hypothetical protein